MTFWEFLLQVFKSRSGISSKRVCGFIGWMVCLFVCIWCTIKVIAAPVIVEMLFVCSTSLLGIDSITGIWKKNIVENTTENKNDKKENKNGCSN